MILPWGVLCVIRYAWRPRQSKCQEDLPVLKRIRLWCPAAGERHNTAEASAYTCARAAAHRRVRINWCVCVRVRVYVCACAAVSTAWIGMSGMIGIEFFKNAFSPGAPPRPVVWARCVSAGQGPVAYPTGALPVGKHARPCTAGRPRRGHNRFSRPPTSRRRRRIRFPAAAEWSSCVHLCTVIVVAYARKTKRLPRPLPDNEPTTKYHFGVIDTKNKRIQSNISHSRCTLYCIYTYTI